jgi:FixJ family two-component response regulator
VPVVDATERVYVVDDDEPMRDSLVWLLESRGFQVEAYASAEAFLARLHDEMYGCLVLDVRMPGMSGLELFERLQARGVTLPVIFVTGHGDVPMAVSAVKKGAVDFIEKPFNDEEMLRLVEQCLESDRAQRASRRLREEVQRRIASLTDREREVMDLVTAGRMNKQIADELGIAMKTVEVHRARVMEKLGAESVAELVQLVMESGGRRR